MVNFFNLFEISFTVILFLLLGQINMKGLDGIQGPVYVGTGCVFRRQALYGYNPPKRAKRPRMVSCDCCPCFGRKKKLDSYKCEVNGDAANAQGHITKILCFNFQDNLSSLFNKILLRLFFPLFSFSFFSSGFDDDKELLMSQMNFEKKFGQSAIFVTSTLMIEGGVPPSSSPAALLKEAIHVISCGYEDKTEWGLEVILSISGVMYF